MQTIATVVLSLLIVAALIGVAVFLGRGWRKMGTTRPTGRGADGSPVRVAQRQDPRADFFLV